MSEAPYDPSFNYCTNWFDSIHFGPINMDWGVCCYYHDIAYANLVDKSTADEGLRECVIQATGLIGTPMAWLMWAAVSTFGILYYIRAMSKRRSSGG